MSRVLRRLWCMVAGHNYFRIARISAWSHHLGCHRCGEQFGMNTEARALIPWDTELADFHREVNGYER